MDLRSDGIQNVSRIAGASLLKFPFSEPVIVISFAADKESCLIRLDQDNETCDLSGLDSIAAWKALNDDNRKVLTPLLGQYLVPNTIPAPDYGSTNVRYFLDPDAMDRFLSARPEMYELGLLPIAQDDGGNCFCVSFNQDTLNAVYYWDDDSVLNLGITKLRVAKDLTSFFELISYEE